MKVNLHGKVAVVTGASRGAGRGIALALGDAGVTVYVAGRTVRGGTPPADGAPGTIDDTAQEVTARGGTGVAVQTDCSSDEQVAQLFARVQREQKRLDVLANAVWDWDPESWNSWGKPFWKQPLSGWQHHVLGGAFPFLLAARHAAPLFAASRGGLIATVTDHVMADGSQPYAGQIFIDLGHQCLNRMVLGMAQDLKRYKVAVAALMPGFMQTERVLMKMTSEKLKRQFRFDLSESPEYVGRAVAALAADPKATRFSGQVVFVADLAREYGFTDVDGRQPGRFDPSS